MAESKSNSFIGKGGEPGAFRTLLVVGRSCFSERSFPLVSELWGRIWFELVRISGESFAADVSGCFVSHLVHPTRVGGFCTLVHLFSCTCSGPEDVDELYQTGVLFCFPTVRKYGWLVPRESEREERRTVSLYYGVCRTEAKCGKVASRDNASPLILP